MFYECATTEDPVDKSYDNVNENDVNDDDDDIFNYSKYETTTSNDDYYHLTCLDNNNKVETSYNQIMTKAHSTTNLNTVNTLCAIENNKFGSMNFECVSKTRIHETESSVVG